MAEVAYSGMPMTELFPTLRLKIKLVAISTFSVFENTCCMKLNIHLYHTLIKPKST